MNLSGFPAFDGRHNIRQVAHNIFYPDIPSMLNSSNLNYAFPQAYVEDGGSVPRAELWDTNQQYYFQYADLNTKSPGTLPSVAVPIQALGYSSQNPPEIQNHRTPPPPPRPASSDEAWSHPAPVNGCTANGSRGRDQRVIDRRRKRAAKEVCLACNGLDFTVKRSLENHIMAAHLGMRFSCPIEGCTKSYPHASSLGRHIREKHSGIMQDYVGTLT